MYHNFQHEQHSTINGWQVLTMDTDRLMNLSTHGMYITGSTVKNKVAINKMIV